MHFGKIIVLGTTMSFIAACGASEAPIEDFQGSEVTSDANSDTNAVSFAHVYADANGMLYSNRVSPNPMALAPDGSQLTEDDWNAFRRAKARIRCDESGGDTTVKIRARGLIPHGVYTIWHFLTDGTGVGALGAPDGSGNAFTADQYGRGTLDVTDELCDFGRLVFAYHFDNNTWGSSPGPAETWATHFVVELTEEDALPARFSETVKTKLVSYAHVYPDGADGYMYSNRDLPNPEILTPDGTHLDNEGWQIRFVRTKLKCRNNENRYKIKARGLIPNGVYTIWHFLSDGTGAGALGDPSGSDNILIADGNGRADLEVLDEVCDIGRLVFAYHLDNNTWGSSPGPAETWVTHLVADFQADD